MATAGRAAKMATISASITVRCSAGSLAIFSTRSPNPLLRSTPSAASVAACFVNRSLKKTRTARPNMMGSETFIIVAFKWREKSTPSFLACAICWAKKAPRAFLLMKVASRISLACRVVFSFRTTTWAALAIASGVAPAGAGAGTNSRRTLVAAGTVIDFSLEKKSSCPMVATLVFEVGSQAPMECGCLRAYSLTAFGARRSELPSRSTGLTAEPMTLAYRALASFSPAVVATSGKFGSA